MRAVGSRSFQTFGTWRGWRLVGHAQTMTDLGDVAEDAAFDSPVRIDDSQYNGRGSDRKLPEVLDVVLAICLQQVIAWRTAALLEKTLDSTCISARPATDWALASSWRRRDQAATGR